MSSNAAPGTPAATKTIIEKPPAAWLAPLLAGVAGFVDTTGFIVFAGIFLAHVTGNFVVLGATLSGQDHGSTGLKLAVLPIFIVGVAIAWLIMRRSPRRGARHIATTESVMLLTCGGIGIWVRHAGSMTRAAELAAIVCGVLAMGLQSMLARSMKLPMTHVMTGNVTQLTVDLLDARFGRPECGATARKNITLIAAFAAGAACAGLLVSSFGLIILLIPAGMLLGLSRSIK